MEDTVSIHDPKLKRAADLALVREVHVERIARARKVDPRYGGPIGMPFKLTALGCYLADNGVDMPQSDGELWHGFDCSRYLDLLQHRDATADATLREGEALAAAILEAIRAGTDPLIVRVRSNRSPGHCPSPVPAGVGAVSSNRAGAAPERRVA